MKKIKSFVIATAITAVAVVPVFATVSGLVSTSVSTSTSTSTSVSVSVDQYILGDVDNDSEITLNDASLALKAALRIEILSEKAVTAADVDKDGEVSLNDASMILKAALKIEKAF